MKKDKNFILQWSIPLSSLSSFHETSQRIYPLWELLPSNLSWRPIGSRQSKWLANCREACKYELERQYKCGARDNYVRIFFFTLLNLGYGLNYYNSRLSRPHGCSSAAFRWVWHFLKGSPSALWSAVDLRDSDDELVPTKCPHSSHRRTSRTRHQPGFSRPLPWRCGEPKADAGAKGSHVAADAARKIPLCKHAAPTSERRSALYKAQSLSSSLIHRITAPHPRLPCVEDIF